MSHQQKQRPIEWTDIKVFRKHNCQRGIIPRETTTQSEGKTMQTKMKGVYPSQALVERITEESYLFRNKLNLEDKSRTHETLLTKW